MQFVLTTLIVLAAAAYLAWQWMPARWRSPFQRGRALVPDTGTAPGCGPCSTCGGCGKGR